MVARFFALVYICTGIAAVSGQVKFEKVVKDFENSSALTIITGFITLLTGIALVTYHNIWVKDWTVLVTIVGWIALLKGVMLIAFPQIIPSFKSWYKNTRAWGWAMIVLGLVFAYFSFVV